MTLLDQKRLGLILRVFSPKAELVEKSVQQIVETIDLAGKLIIGGRQVFSRIDILVSADNRYGDTDCGLTREALLKKIDQLINKNKIYVTEISHGDIYCGMLNRGVADQMLYGLEFSMILSSGVKDYLTFENMTAMLEALERGARVTGLAITELAPSILEGRIANTCAIWDNISLMTVNGFDLRAAKPLKDDRLANYVRGWSLEKGEVFYHAAGVEEILPLIRLIKHFGGPCIAPILPVTGARWEVSDDPDVQKREINKLGTKFERQMRWAVMEDVDLSFIKGGVMPEYRVK
ncbi:MAG: hypothetical protein AAB474_01650 [Patescibacteria group bacterium]